MAPRKIFFEAVRVGDELPSTAKAPIDRVQLARYAGATGDYHPLYVDDAYARGLGMPTVVAPATLGLSFLGQLVTEWARGARIKRLHARFVRLLWPGDTLVCRGRVADRHGADGRYFIEIDLRAENQKGDLVLRGGATLEVFYSADDEHRARVGQPRINVTVARSLVPVPSPVQAPAPAVSPPKKAASARQKKPVKKGPARR